MSYGSKDMTIFKILDLFCQTALQKGYAWDLGENGYMFMYGWIPSMFTWNYHSIVHQLNPNVKQKVKKKKIPEQYGTDTKTDLQINETG